MGDNLERTNGVAERPWSSFEFHGNVACKNAKRRVEIAGEFTALLRKCPEIRSARLRRGFRRGFLRDAIAKKAGEGNRTLVFITKCRSLTRAAIVRVDLHCRFATDYADA